MFIKIANCSVGRVLKKNNFQKLANKKIVEYDPEYIYVTVRALTADKPNANGDCFPHEELIRIDPVLNRPVYASFIGKGVYINHKNTDDPRYAKGIVLDARYVADDENDKYVELLLSIDKKKDPVFARDVERGLINKFSMGASVRYTRCSVCNNEARTKEDFCDHIAKQKMQKVNFNGVEKLAYELCYGVTYNEISAVSDPADESAQILAKIANRQKKILKKHKNYSSRIVKKSDTTLEALMAKTADTSNDKATKDMDEELFDELSEQVLDDETPEDMADTAPEGPEAPKELATEQVADVLNVVQDLLTQKIEPEEAVSALEEITSTPESDEEGETVEELSEEMTEQPLDEEEGGEVEFLEEESEEGSEEHKDKVSSFTAWLEKQAKENSADEQYPYEDAMKKKHPKQYYPSKPHKARPKSDFAKDVKRYNELMNISAEFVDNKDRRLSGWRIMDGSKPLYFVGGARAWGEHLDDQWDYFRSRDYGANLVSAILEDGLDKTMRRVNAVRIRTMKASAPAPILDEKMLKAAEAKAADLAKVMNDNFKIRLVEGIKLALKLQNKNVFDNPIKGAAWEVLNSCGLDTSIADRIATNEVIEAHFDEALRKALEYTEMSPEAFEEVRAHAETLAARPVTASTAASSNGDEPSVGDMEEAARQYLIRRASKNLGGIKTPAGDTPQKSFDRALSEAVRAGSSIPPPPRTPLNYAHKK